MRTHIYIFVAILMWLVADIVLASDWRGIIPLHSTRADVEKKLSVPSSGKDYDRFEMKEYTVYIRYTTERCEGNAPGNWDVPIGTVHLIDVLPKTRVSLSTLNVNLRQFKVSEVYDVDGAKIYTDVDNGFEFEYYEKRDTIVRLAYFPSNKDSHLRCQKR